MAHVLRLSFLPGPTQRILTSGNYRLLHWTPNIAQKRIISRDAPKSGAIIEDVYEEHVDEKFIIEVVGASKTLIAEYIEDLHEALSLAQFKRKGSGARVWIEWIPDGGATYRSEVLYGRLIPDKDFYHYQWVGNVVECTLEITRRFYWEGDPVTLVNAVQVENEDVGGGVENHVNTVSGAVHGHLMIPPEITIENTIAATTVGQIFISLNHQDAALADFFQAEAGTLGTPSSSTPDVNASAGYYMTSTWATDPEIELARYDLASWDFPPAWFHIIMRFHEKPTSSYPAFRFAIETPDGEIWRGEQWTALTDREMQLVDTIPIPPWPYTDFGHSSASLDLVLYAQRTGGATTKIDFFQITPLDGFRVANPAVGGIDNTEELIIPPDDVGSPWKETAGSEQHANYRVSGSEFLMQHGSGITNLFYFLWNRDDGTAPKTHTLGITIKYRPRFLLP